MCRRVFPRYSHHDAPSVDWYLGEAQKEYEVVSLWAGTFSVLLH